MTPIPRKPPSYQQSNNGNDMNDPTESAASAESIPNARAPHSHSHSRQRQFTTVFKTIVFGNILFISVFVLFTILAMSELWRYSTGFLYSKSLIASSNNHHHSVVMVIPFIHSQVDTVVSSISRWEKFPPCSLDENDNRVLPVDLVFYYHKDITTQQGIITKLKSSIPPRAATCFRRIRFITAQLTDEQDTYPLGASYMFFRLFGFESFLKNYDVLVYLEPDVGVCRQNWSERMYEETGGYNSSFARFWMRGSVIRHGPVKMHDWSFGEHINGNAYYNLHDPEFREYLQIVEKEFWKSPDKFLKSFDIALYSVRRLLRDVVSWWEHTDWLRYFQYSPTIANVYRTKVNGTEFCESYKDTYLVHGKNVFW